MKNGIAVSDIVFAETEDLPMLSLILLVSKGIFIDIKKVLFVSTIEYYNWESFVFEYDPCDTY